MLAAAKRLGRPHPISAASPALPSGTLPPAPTPSAVPEVQPPPAGVPRLVESMKRAAKHLWQEASDGVHKAAAAVRVRARLAAEWVKEELLPSAAAWRWDEGRAAARRAEAAAGAAAEAQAVASPPQPPATEAASAAVKLVPAARVALHFGLDWWFALDEDGSLQVGAALRLAAAAEAAARLLSELVVQRMLPAHCAVWAEAALRLSQWEKQQVSSPSWNHTRPSCLPQKRHRRA